VTKPAETLQGMLGELVIIESEFIELEDCFSKIRLVVEYNGKREEGYMFVENDGRDIDFEGFQSDFYELWTEHDEVWEDVEQAIMDGYEAWNKINVDNT